MEVNQVKREKTIHDREKSMCQGPEVVIFKDQTRPASGKHRVVGSSV